MFDLSLYLKEQKAVIDAALDRQLPREDASPALIHQAMRYSVMGGGKRLRPILCMAAARAIDPNTEAPMLAAISIEILHTYTLIHDDLPAMDNDDLRRGQPTSHKKFGEANAILTGDALLTLAFEWLSQCPVTPPCSSQELCKELAEAAGSHGVIGGQYADLKAENETPDKDTLLYIHQHKTARLLEASVRMGAISAGASADQLESLSAYGRAIGLAFQIIDDILDETTSEEVLGKTAGSDQANNKMTYVSLFGLETAKKEAVRLRDEALNSLPSLQGETDPLKAIARYIIDREY